jgi:hypothetical protein
MNALRFLKFIPNKMGFGKLPVELLFDVSRSGNGYANKVHRDSDARCIVFLIYFNEIDGTGGNLDVLRYKGEDSGNPPAYPLESDCEILESVSPAAGRLVIFENTPYAFHAVQEMVGSSKGRYFCYGGYTSLTGVNPEFTRAKHKSPTEFNLFT